MNESINRMQGYLADISQMTNNAEQSWSSVAERPAAQVSSQQGFFAFYERRHNRVLAFQ